MGHLLSATTILFVHLAVIFVCVFINFAPLISAGPASGSEVPALDRLIKRDVYMGLKMQCKTHPRNCPGGYMLKRKRLSEPLLDSDPTASQETNERLSSSPVWTRGGNLQTLRYQLLSLLLPSLTERSGKVINEW